MIWPMILSLILLAIAVIAYFGILAAADREVAAKNKRARDQWEQEWAEFERNLRR